jgi:hypothetical protein
MIRDEREIDAFAESHRLGVDFMTTVLQIRFVKGPRKTDSTSTSDHSCNNNNIVGNRIPFFFSPRFVQMNILVCIGQDSSPDRLTHVSLLRIPYSADHSRPPSVSGNTRDPFKRLSES